MHDTIIILDYGSQTAQLIARRVRELHVYCELIPWDAPADRVIALQANPGPGRPSLEAVSSDGSPVTGSQPLSS